MRCWVYNICIYLHIYLPQGSTYMYNHHWREILFYRPDHSCSFSFSSTIVSLFYTLLLLLQHRPSLIPRTFFFFSSFYYYFFHCPAMPGLGSLPFSCKWEIDWEASFSFVIYPFLFLLGDFEEELWTTAFTGEHTRLHFEIDRIADIIPLVWIYIVTNIGIYINI